MLKEVVNSSREACGRMVGTGTGAREGNQPTVANGYQYRGCNVAFGRQAGAFRLFAVCMMCMRD